jgi:hypothetical protein
MAKPKQSKYSRAHMRSRVRRPKQGASRTWLYATIGIALVGALLVVLTYNDRQDRASGAPTIGDHWHAYLGVNICGTWEPAVPAFEGRDGSQSGSPRAGIHSHGDFLIHDHPFASDESGKNATLGRYLEYAQSSVSRDSIKLWENWAPGVDKSNGDACGKKPGMLQWKVGMSQRTWPTKARSGNPSDLHIENGQIIALYFVPAGDKLVEPPGAQDALNSINDLNGQSAVPTTVAGTPTPSVTAPATESTTSSSSPAGGSSGTP